MASEMKCCKACGESKPQTAFTRNPSTRDGLRNQCKSCQAEHLRTWVEQHPEQSRAQDARDYARHGRRKSKDSSPEKKRAHRALYRAVLAGEVKRATVCNRCGEEGRVEAHHEDYGRPLEVEWLCARCHRRHHESIPLLDDALELATLIRPAWGDMAETIPAWHPRNEGDPDPDPDPDPSKGDPDPGKGDPDPDPDPDPGKEPDWKAESRKHERRAKAEKKAREDAEKKLKDQEDADKTEQQRAIDAAKEEGRTAALTEAQKERRSDRLEVAVTRLAAKGVKVGDKDGVKFADPEDAQILIEKAIARGDIDEDEVFDSEGKVQTDALTTALSDLLARKPHLADSVNGRPSGESDAGKGSAGKGLEDMSVEEHFQAIKKT